MAKNDNAHALRLHKSLLEHGHEAAAHEIAERHPLSKSADVKKKYAWARDVSKYLEEKFDDGSIREIRRDCRCNDGASIAEKIRRYLKKSGSISDFAKMFNEGENFAFIEYISENHIVFCYPECYCACVKRHSGTLSRAWCYCTLGNAEGIFRSVFGSGVQVALLESIKTGAEKCAIDVQW